MQLPAHHSNLSGSVDLAVSMLNKDKERMYQMQALLATMVNAFKQLALQAEQISYSQASQTANSLFPVEDSIIKNATLAKGLTPCQYVAVKFASYNYSTAIRRGKQIFFTQSSSSFNFNLLLFLALYSGRLVTFRSISLHYAAF